MRDYRIKWEPILNSYIFGNRDGIELFPLSDNHQNLNEIEFVRRSIKSTLGFLNIDTDQINEEDIIRHSELYPGAFSFPNTISIQTTQMCIYRCAFCYDDHGLKAKDELSKEKIFSIVDEFASNGGMRIEWTGGEALSRKDVWEIADYTYSKGISQNILTNFAIADLRDAMSLMKKYFYNVQVSCNAYGDSYNQIIKRNMWDRFVENLKKSRQFGLHITLTTVVMENNLHELELIAKLCLETGIDEWRLGWLTLIGRSRTRWESYRKVIDDTYPIIIGLKERYGDRLNITSPLDKYDDDQITYMYPKEFYLSPGGRDMLYIQSTGETYPFPFLVYPEFYVGNIKEKTLKEMWSSEKLFPLRQVNYSTTECSGCNKLCGFWERTFLYSYSRDIYQQPPTHRGCTLRDTSFTGNL